MKILQILIFIGFCYSPYFALSQGAEGNNWYFGNHAGLTWNVLQANNNPMYLMDGEIYTNEGVATISDPLGNLLFYTDGSTVWASDHSIWPNTLPGSVGGELLGNPSSTQSGIIVPKPLDPNTYYVFCVDNNIGANGLTYSRADMTLNFGLGDIDPAEKNILLHTPSCEKIAAIYHSNGIDIWVVSHSWNSNSFYAYLVTSSGVNIANPVVSNVGTLNSGASSVTRGYMKASYSGEKIAVGIEGLNIYELFDFNIATGVLSNAITFSAPPPTSPGIIFDDCFGVEFSPDEHYLYGSERWGYDIHQWDIQLPTPTAIIGSHNVVATLGSSNGGALQLAPDLKIYCARNNSNYLGCINNPMVYGTGCNYIDQQVLLGPDISTAHQSKEGLPTVLASPFYNIYPPFDIVASCDNDTVFFTINTMSFDIAYWNLDFPNSDPLYNITTVNSEISFVYPENGIYTIELITLNNGSYDTIYQDVPVSNFPVVDLGPDLVICSDDSVNFDLSFNNQYSISGQSEYFWTAQINSNVYYDSSSSFTIFMPGIYTATVFVDTVCGSLTDELVVSLNSVEVDLGPDTILGPCEGTPFILDATYLDFTYGVTYYFWSTNEITSTISVTTSGIYYVTVSLSNCQVVDSVEVIFDTPLINPLGSDIYLCSGMDTIVSGAYSDAIYNWSTGDSTLSILVDSAGIYSVTATNGCGAFLDEIVIHSLDTPEIDLGPDLGICSGSAEVLDAFYSESSYIWNTGQITPQLIVMSEGDYIVTVTNQCGSDIDSINVFNEFPLVIELGSDSSVCYGYILDAGYFDADYFWSTGETTQSIDILLTGDYSVEVTNSCGVFTDNISVLVNPLPIVDFGVDTLVSQGSAAFSFNPGVTAASYLWSTGDTTAIITIYNEGYYSLTITDEYGCVGSGGLYIQMVIGVNEIDKSKVILFPNPASEFISIEFSDLQVKNVLVYNSIGKLLGNYKNNGSKLSIETYNMPDGVYFVKVIAKNGEYIIKPFSIVR